MWKFLSMKMLCVENFIRNNEVVLGGNANPAEFHYSLKSLKQEIFMIILKK